MKEYLIYLRNKYQRYVGNFEWHLDTNGEHLQPLEKEGIQKRIQDLKEVISDLNKII